MLGALWEVPVDDLSSRLQKVDRKLQVAVAETASIFVSQAQFSGSMKVAPDALGAEGRGKRESALAQDVDGFDGLLAEGSGHEVGPPSDEPAKVPSEEDLLVSVFAESVVQLPKRLEKLATGARGRLRTFTLTRAEADAMARDPKFGLVEPAETLHRPDPQIGSALVERPGVTASLMAGSAAGASSASPLPELSDTPVLIGVIDVGGFDFTHPDFLDDHGDTRFVAIWDQGGRLRSPPKDFAYGSELTHSHLKAAQDAARNAPPGAAAPAWRLEPQSVTQEASHGTHVASIAAGNSGVCPDALIAGVLVDIPELADPRLSFYDTSRIVHAVEWLVTLAEAHGATLAVNISLATNGHAHDASSPGARWIDALLTVPGRAVCVAAGNSGQEGAAFEGDLGWRMGRVHAEGHIPGPGLIRDLEWLVAGGHAADISGNELEIWYSGQDRFTVQLQAPDGQVFPAVGPGEHLSKRPVEGGGTVTVISETYYPANGANHVAIYLSPGENGIGVMPGRWRVRLRGERIRDGRFHAWIERDDPGRTYQAGGRRVRRHPSFFSSDSFVDRSTVSSLACGERLISVANLDAAEERIHPTSSQGPTRDGRPKPEVAAPGVGVVAARGFADRRVPWVAMTGTSMASPYVCGVVAHMLRVNPGLTAAQIGGILRATARPLPGASYAWEDDAGYGAVDADAAVREAAAQGPTREVTP